MRAHAPAVSIAYDDGIAASPTVTRTAMLAIIVFAAIAGFLATGQEQTALALSQDGADLARLMRFMAVAKLLLAAFVTAGLLWRLGAAVSIPRLTGYTVAAATMSAGPGLIWGMVHISLGVLLLHGGLFTLVVLLWRDRATSTRLADLVAFRRRALP